MCGEWDFGGLPAWLLDGRLQQGEIRTDTPAYMAAVDRFWRRGLLPLLAPWTVAAGGPVAANSYAVAVKGRRSEAVGGAVTVNFYALAVKGGHSEAPEGPWPSTSRSWPSRGGLRGPERPTNGILLPGNGSLLSRKGARGLSRTAL